MQFFCDVVLSVLIMVRCHNVLSNCVYVLAMEMTLYKNERDAMRCLNNGIEEPSIMCLINLKLSQKTYTTSLLAILAGFLTIWTVLAMRDVFPHPECPYSVIGLLLSRDMMSLIFSNTSSLPLNILQRS